MGTTVVYERFGVSGRTVIVTGASRGIGRSIAKMFAAADADVVLCSRSADELASVADTINDSTESCSALPVECDVTDRDTILRLVDERWRHSAVWTFS
jgi:NAD(P)-dependent dehydrogenase (short-subunit alcohol dehydrogenase family)